MYLILPLTKVILPRHLGWVWLNLPCENCVYTCILVGCKTDLLFICSKLDRVIPFLRGFGSPWREWICLGICPWNWWSADETHRRRNWATATVGIAPLRFSSSPPFRSSNAFPVVDLRGHRWESPGRSGGVVEAWGGAAHVQPWPSFFFATMAS